MQAIEILPLELTQEVFDRYQLPKCSTREDLHLLYNMSHIDRLRYAVLHDDLEYIKKQSKTSRCLATYAAFAACKQLRIDIIELVLQRIYTDSEVVNLRYLHKVKNYDNDLKSRVEVDDISCVPEHARTIIEQHLTIIGPRIAKYLVDSQLVDKDNLFSINKIIETRVQLIKMGATKPEDFND